MAPEVLDGKYGQECDIWSLGVTLYQLLTGQMPFEGRSKAEVFMRIKTGKFSIPSVVSPNCRDLLTKMIELNPKKRLTATQALDHPWIK